MRPSNRAGNIMWRVSFDCAEAAAGNEPFTEALSAAELAAAGMADARAAGEGDSDCDTAAAGATTFAPVAAFGEIRFAIPGGLACADVDAVRGADMSAAVEDVDMPLGSVDVALEDAGVARKMEVS